MTGSTAAGPSVAAVRSSVAAAGSSITVARRSGSAALPAAAAGCSIAAEDLALLTSLTSLFLSDGARVCSCSSGLCCVSALKELQNLELHYPTGDNLVTYAASLQRSKDLGAALQQLQQLTYLLLSVEYLYDSALAGISRLRNLQDLLVASSHGTTAHADANLPSP